MSLKYEPASVPLHISVKWLFWGRERAKEGQVDDACASGSLISPETRNTKHETRNPNPETETRSTKHETRNPKPEAETRNPKPETRNPKPETETRNRNSKPETRN